MVVDKDTLPELVDQVTVWVSEEEETPGGAMRDLQDSYGLTKEEAATVVSLAITRLARLHGIR